MGNEWLWMIPSKGPWALFIYETQIGRKRNGSSSFTHGEYLFLYYLFLYLFLAYSKTHSVGFISSKTLVGLVSVSEIFRNIALGFS